MDPFCFVLLIVSSGIATGGLAGGALEIHGGAGFDHNALVLL